MPRNAAGVYSLPDPPRVPNTVIDSPDENTTRNDIGAELTNSLDRNGRGGMLAPFRIADGTLAAPGLAFLNEPGSGLYRIGAGDWALAVQGAKVMEMTAGVLTIPVTLNVQTLGVLGNLQLNGSLNALGAIVLQPTQPLYFDGGGDTFMAETSANVVEIVTGGSQSLKFFPNGIAIQSGDFFWLDGGVGGDTYLFESAANVITVAAGGTISAQFTPSAVVFPAAHPIYIDGGGNTYFLESSPDNVQLTAGGNLAMQWWAAGVAVPSLKPFYFDGGSDTYIQESAANQLRFACGAAVALNLTATFAQFQTHLSIPQGKQLGLDGGGGTYLTKVTAPDAVRILTNNITVADFLTTGVAIPSGFSFYVDGGGDTYITELAPNVMDLVVGGATKIRMVTAAVSNFFGVWAMTSGNPLYFDGGIDTYIQESPGDNLRIACGGQLAALFTPAAQVFFVSGTEAGRFTAQRYHKVSDNGVYRAGAGPYHEMFTNAADWVCFNTNNNAASPFGLAIWFTGAAPNNAGNYFLDCTDTVGLKFRAKADGGLANFSGNNLNLCSLAVKREWEPYSYAQLEVLSAAVDAMDFGRFKYNDQTHDDWNHGYSAEGVRDAFRDAACELTEEVDWGTPDEKKMLLSVYPTDLTNINLAVAKHEIRKLKAEVADLKARLQ